MQASFIILQSPFHRNILLPCYANKLLKSLMSSLLESYRPACIAYLYSLIAYSDSFDLHCTGATNEMTQFNCVAHCSNTCVHCPVFFHNAFVPLWQIKPFLKLFLRLFSTPLPHCVVVFIIYNMNAKKFGGTMQHKKYFRIFSLLVLLSCQFMKVF